MKKKLVTLALAMSMSLSIVPAQAASLPADVSDSWCRDYVADLMDKGIVGGYADGTYRPTSPVSRGAIAKMAFLSMQAAGSSLKESAENDPFSDMKDNWAEGYAAVLANTGNLLPSEFGYKYEASKDMTRLETAKLLTRIYLYAHPREELAGTATLEFTDADSISASDAPLVAKAVELGIISGYSDGSFKPDASINRGTAAAMISRFLGTVGTISDPAQFVNSTGGNGYLSTDTTNAPVIQNVEWVIPPSIEIDDANTATSYLFLAFSQDGFSGYKSVEDQKMTYIDTNGRTYRYEDADLSGGFSNGYTVARKISTGKYGMIDVSGKWVLEPEFDYVSKLDYVCYNDGAKILCCSARKGDERIALNQNFEVINEILDRVSEVDHEATAAANDRRAYLSITADGEKAFSTPTFGGLTIYSKMLGTGGGRQPCYGICDKNGRVIVRPTALTSSYGGDPLHGSYYKGSVEDDCIVLTHQVSVRFDTVDDIYDGTTGKLLYSCANTAEAAEKYNIDHRYLYDYGQGLFVTAENGVKKWGYMDKTGRMVIPAVFDRADTFSNGYAWVKYDGLWGVIKLPQF